MAKSILIANRGEIALRVIRAAKANGLKTIIVYSEADKNSLPVRLADSSVCIGPAAPNLSYLNQNSIISAAEMLGADLIHPGYGFLSENAEFVEKLESNGFVLVGPSCEAIKTMGDKVTAIKTMSKLGVPCVPGSNGILTDNKQEIIDIADKIGYPVLIKASGGGGGRGMRVVWQQSELIEAVQMTRSEAKSAFNNPDVYMEKFLERPRHIEIQVFGDGNGNAIHIGERDCSMQRKHQKVIEEAQAPGLSDEERNSIFKICTEACKGLKYRGAGTFEFLYQDGSFYFIEMNTRIQVEHPISEQISQTDLVSEQIYVALNGKLSIKQSDIKFNGHSIECRINAENPKTFIPSPGVINTLHVPGGPGVRFDSHIYQNYRIPHYYDSMIAKLICTADTRAKAINRMHQALNELVIDGVETNIALHKKILSRQDFMDGNFSIHFVEKMLQQESSNE